MTHLKINRFNHMKKITNLCLILLTFGLSSAPATWMLPPNRQLKDR